ncbi:G protein subunit beta [Bonamia ostreae]|uniref:G protein subunit beta n=1 Tax=Bonamia ostreae TaxID=126728 RepID=A0ABV2AV53_9EUKA
MSVAIKKSSNIFVTGSCDANSKIFDVRAGKNSVATFAGHESDINSVCFFNDINCIGTGSDDSSCRLYDMRSMQQLNRYVSDNILCGITSVVPSRGGKYLFAGYDDYNVYAWDVLSGEPAMTTTAHENRVSCIDINRDGLALATGSWDTFVKIWA